MPDLARFLKSIGIDLQGEENPYLKTIILTKKINKTPESKEVKIEIMVDEEIGREYHIYPKSEMSQKNPKNPIFTTNYKSEIGQKITEYNNILFTSVAFSKPKIFSLSQLSSHK